MWSTGELCDCFIDRRNLAGMSPSTMRKFYRYLFAASVWPWLTGLFTSLFSLNTEIMGPIFWGVSAGVFLVGLYNAIRSFVLDKKHRIVRNRFYLALFLLLAFICPIAVACKSIFTTTIDEATGDWTYHYFDPLFFLFVYLPVQFVYLGLMQSAYLKPLSLATYPNYAGVVSKEGKIFLNCWNWDSARRFLPSIDDYDVKGRAPSFRILPLYVYVIDEGALDSIQNNRDRKGFAINAGLSLAFAFQTGFVSIVLGFGFDRPILIVFSALCLVNFIPFIYFSIRLVCLNFKYRVFKNPVALWASLILGTALAAGFAIAGYFNTINGFDENGNLVVHLIDGGTFLGYLIAWLAYFLFVFFAYLDPFLRHFGKRC